MDFSSLSEHAIIAALESLDEDHPIVIEISRLVDTYTLQAHELIEEGKDPFMLSHSMRFAAPINQIALELVLDNMENFE